MTILKTAARETRPEEDFAIDAWMKLISSVKKGDHGLKPFTI